MYVLLYLSLNGFFGWFKKILLCNLTIKWVLCTLFASKNNFLSLNKFFHLFSVANRKKKEKRKTQKNIYFLRFPFFFSVSVWKTCLNIKKPRAEHLFSGRNTQQDMFWTAWKRFWTAFDSFCLICIFFWAEECLSLRWSAFFAMCLFYFIF